MIIGYASGTFDLFHVGHLNLLKNAKAHCDYLIVGIHRDGSWKGKKTYIPFEDRVAIVEACRYVDRVEEASDEDITDWNRFHFHRLFVGSDYKGSERFMKYEEWFADKNVKIIYFPYTEKISSSMIREKLREDRGVI